MPIKTSEKEKANGSKNSSRPLPGTPVVTKGHSPSAALKKAQKTNGVQNLMKSEQSSQEEGSEGEDEISVGQDSIEDEDDEEDDDEEEEEEDDVTEEALERMMALLEDVDPSELHMLNTVESHGSADEFLSEAEDEDSDEEGDDDEDEDEDEDEAEETFVQEGAIRFEDADLSDTDVIPIEKNTVNDEMALQRVLTGIKSDASFFESLTLSYPEDLNIPDPQDDLQRELEFYKQSLWAAERAEVLFNEEALPFKRPSDYFAEMLKTDAHMSLIREKLLDESAGIKASEDARKLRDAKKFGKKVQIERLKEREKEKKDVGKRLESLKKKRKNGDGGFATTEDFDIALEDAIAGPAKKRKTVESERGRRGGRGVSRGMSRRGRDSKFGNPTTSRRPKENNNKLDGDGISGDTGRRFSSKSSGSGGRGGRGGRGGGGGRGGRGGRGAKQRPGKSRRG